jgi:hypothetical protein
LWTCVSVELVVPDGVMSDCANAGAANIKIAAAPAKLCLNIELPLSILRTKRVRHRAAETDDDRKWFRVLERIGRMDVDGSGNYGGINRMAGSIFPS